MPLRSDIRKGYGPTYHTIYDISYGEFATDKPFCVRRPNIFETTPFFTQRLICHVCTEPRHNTYFSMFAQSPCDVLFYNPDEEPCTDTIYIYNSVCVFVHNSRLIYAKNSHQSLRDYRDLPRRTTPHIGVTRPVVSMAFPVYFQYSLRSRPPYFTYHKYSKNS